jgi:hypothetical protein
MQCRNETTQHWNPFKPKSMDLFEQFVKKVGFEVLTAVVMKSSILWNITHCSPLKINLRFRGTYASIFRVSGCYLLHIGFLVALFFDPED